MGQKLIKCHGRCKKKKAPMFFRPSDRRAKYPICRECRNSYAPTPARRPDLGTMIWARSARRLFVTAITEGRAR
jgi:hypothetical protein